MKESIKLTVIIPVFNQEKLIFRAIESIPCRDDIEIIVIDDYSLDNTLEKLRKFQMESDYNLVILSNEENKGVGYSINRGLDLASGEYVVFLGSDDYFVNLENVFTYNCLNNEDLIYFDLQINDGSFFKLNDKSKYGFCGSVKFMKRSFIGSTREPEIRQGEDWYFYKELMKKEPKEKYLNSNIMYKHYNYPRKGSLTWNAIHEGE